MIIFHNPGDQERIHREMDKFILLSWEEVNRLMERQDEGLDLNEAIEEVLA